MKAATVAGVITWLGLCALPSSALAQRQLHWDRLDVAAHLNADGTLTITETQSMVFTGDWNGGERRFNVRPRQHLTLTGMSREVDGVWRPMSEDSSLDDVDDYWMNAEHTLRWRSRRPDDPPFASTAIRYQIRSVFSGILLKEADTYRLDHDFAFRDRDAAIVRFELKLTLDPEWQPITPVPPLYTDGPLAPNKTFVLNLPLRYTGADDPAARDMTRPRELMLGVTAILGIPLLALVGWFVREQRYGRFAALTENVDEAWVRAHILKHPAEVVAAAWDENVGTAEVVALIARMVADGQLESTVAMAKNKDASMTLRLKVDRKSLNGHERALVDALFFGNRFETSTSGVRAHYRSKGFNPANVITPTLEAAVDKLLPPGPRGKRFSPVTMALFVLGVALVLYKWFQGYPGGFLLIFPMIVVAGIGWIAGLKFRSYMNWGYVEAALCLLPAVVIALCAAAYLWYYAGTWRIELAPLTVYGLTSIALACVLSCINAVKSRRSPSAVAFRKTLASGRAYFMRQLETAEPALRDEWFPWLLGLELSKQVDAWSTRAASAADGGTLRSASSMSSRSTSSGSSGSSFSGFTGGRSGGAGASASWAAAAGGMAASVAAPSSRGSSSGSSGGGGGSSSGGSSGGGGGGGW